MVGGATARPPFLLEPELVRDSATFADVLRKLNYETEQHAGGDESART